MQGTRDPSACAPCPEGSYASSIVSGDIAEIVCLPCGSTKDSEKGSALKTDCFCLEGFVGTDCDRLEARGSDLRDVRAFLIEMGWSVNLDLDLVVDLTETWPQVEAGTLLDHLNITGMVADFFDVSRDKVQVMESQVVDKAIWASQASLGSLDACDHEPPQSGGARGAGALLELSSR